MNSSIEMNQSFTLANKLMARTQEQKVVWNADSAMNPLTRESATINECTSSRFLTQLENGLQAKVSLEQLSKICSVTFSLVELVQVGDMSPIEKELLAVRVDVDPPYGFDTAEQKQLSKTLVELYELARRSALKIDASVNKALEYLDKLAV